MSQEPYLIAHLVRGEPAFDVAMRMECPICHGVNGNGTPLVRVGDSCHECDGEGFWWITPTSGHRAYPYDSIQLNNVSKFWLEHLPAPPTNHPDHYTLHAAPRTGLITNLAERLGFVPKPTTITRR
jgi:hypothetical protein